MRIISGLHKGRRISAPKQLPVRPTTDMAKEALFNILHNAYSFDELSVLDLYAGTGNISYEFASRGCNSVVAVDANQRCIKFIDETAKQLNLPIRAVRQDALHYLERNTTRFDIIFADPPYDKPLEDFIRIRDLVIQKGLLKKKGVLIIEHSSRTDLSTLGNFDQQRKYGGSRFSFFHE